MKDFEIINIDGNVIDIVEAKNERQALCLYLMKNEELIDMMLWKNPHGHWRLAEYNDEDNFLRAREVSIAKQK